MNKEQVKLTFAEVQGIYENTNANFQLIKADVKSVDDLHMILLCTVKRLLDNKIFKVEFKVDANSFILKQEGSYVLNESI